LLLFVVTDVDASPAITRAACSAAMGNTTMNEADMYSVLNGPYPPTI
jgi:hypothetical protein